jgi:hypothetical protein
MSDQLGHRGCDSDSTEAYWDDRDVEAVASGQTRLEARTCESKLTALAGLAAVNIETSMAANLSGSLHSLFDDVCDKTLPIYFGPLLGRLYLEGL